MSLKASVCKEFKCTYPQRFLEVSRTYKIRNKSTCCAVFADRVDSLSIIESHQFVGIFVGIKVGEKSRYQHLCRIAQNSPLLAYGRLGSKYNSIRRLKPRISSRASECVAVNKWRKFRASCASHTLEQNNSFLSFRPKTIHPAANHKTTFYVSAKHLRGFTHFLFEVRYE